MLACASPLGAFFPLERIALHVEFELLLQHQVRHLNAFRAIEGSVGCVFRFILPVFTSALVVLLRIRTQFGFSFSVRGIAEQSLVHLFLC